MHRIWYPATPVTTLSGAGETATYDVSSYSAWEFSVVADLAGSTNVVYQMQGSVDGENWHIIKKCAGQSNDGTTSIGPGANGIVTEAVDDATRTYLFVRSKAAGGFRAITSARWFRLQWDTEGLGTSATMALRIRNAWNESE